MNDEKSKLPTKYSGKYSVRKIYELGPGFAPGGTPTMGGGQNTIRGLFGSGGRSSKPTTRSAPAPTPKPTTRSAPAPTPKPTVANPPAPTPKPTVANPPAPTPKPTVGNDSATKVVTNLKPPSGKVGHRGESPSFNQPKPTYPNVQKSIESQKHTNPIPTIKQTPVDRNLKPVDQRKIEVRTDISSMDKIRNATGVKHPQNQDRVVWNKGKPVAQSSVGSPTKTVSSVGSPTKTVSSVNPSNIITAKKASNPIPTIKQTPVDSNLKLVDQGEVKPNPNANAMSRLKKLVNRYKNLGEEKRRHPMADMDGPMPYLGVKGGIKGAARAAAKKINKRLAQAAVKDKDGKVTHYDMSKVDEDTPPRWGHHGSAYIDYKGAPAPNNPADWSKERRKKYPKEWERLNSGKKKEMKEEDQIDEMRGRDKKYVKAAIKDVRNKDRVWVNVTYTGKPEVDKPNVEKAIATREKIKNKAAQRRTSIGKAMKNRHKSPAQKEIKFEGFDLPTSYGGEYSVRNLYEEAEQLDENLKTKGFSKYWKGPGALKRQKKPKMYSDGTDKAEHELKKDKTGGVAFIVRKEKTNEEIEEAAKDRPFTKLAAKVAYGQKGSKRLKSGACPSCGSTNMTFKDALSKKEWGISGLCQKCQDSVFKEEEQLDEVRGDVGAAMRQAQTKKAVKRFVDNYNKPRFKFEPRPIHNKFRDSQKSLKVRRGITMFNPKEETEHLDELKNVAKEYIKYASVDAVNKSWNAAIGRGEPKTNVKRLKRIEGIRNAADRLSGWYTTKVNRGKKGPVWVKRPYHAEETGVDEAIRFGDGSGFETPRPPRNKPPRFGEAKPKPKWKYSVKGKPNQKSPEEMKAEKERFKGKRGVDYL